MNIELESKILEFSLLPYHVVGSNYYESYTDYDKRFLKEVYLEDIKIIDEKIKVVEDRINKYFVFGEAENLMMYTYIYMTRQGKEMYSMEDFYNQALALTEEELLEVLALTTSTKSSNREDLIRYLEDETLNLSEASKWNRVRTVMNPKRTVEESIKIMRYVEDFYTPFYEKYAEERDAYRENFDLERLVKSIGRLDDSILEDMKEGVHTIVLSPIILSMFYFDIKGSKFLGVSCRLEDVFRQDQENTQEYIIAFLKLLADNSRYSVLKAIANDNFRTKDIANELGVSSAAVSFHIRKLINEGLIIVGKDGDDVKYEANTRVIENIVIKLQKDFLAEK
ncbi:MAG: winged helix-turn-helix domain-containing protein [Gemella sp.]|nr:winged helix-turn-helix domain-containing protein [Gemella sp.]